MTCTARLSMAVLLVTVIVATGKPTAAVGQIPSPEASYAVVVKQSTAEDAKWKTVVAALKTKHNASIITYDGSVDESLDALKQEFPRYTCFVAPPTEATGDFVTQVHQLTRKLDDDPYTDTLWGILTGYDADNALAIASHSEPLVLKKVASGTDFATEMVSEGQWYDELIKNKRVKKEPGGNAEQLQGPDDTTQALVDLLNDYRPDLMITSGHATQADWQIGFRYRNGQFRSQAGQMYGLDTQNKRIEINSTNPKVYLPIGNCLMGDINGPDAMALAWMNDVGVKQMLGYTKPTWFGYMGWGVLDYFVEQPGRYTLTEAFFANNHALIHRLKDPGTPNGDRGGLTFDRDVVAFYGDPKWSAKMAEMPKYYDQKLEIKDGIYTFTIIPNRGELSFTPVNTNGSQRGGRPIVQFLPHRIKDVQIVTGEDLSPVVTDDFILVPNPRKCDPGRTYVVRFKASELSGTAKIDSSNPENNPNIVVILADDLGYGDVQCYNPQRGRIATPHIDQLATQGMRFTDAHSSSGVCSPSRYTLLTGRYHWRTRLQSGIVGVFGEPLIAPDRMTIGTLAKQHGYHTATIGKWHLGWNWPIASEQRKLLQAPKKPGKDDEAKPTDGEAVATAEQQTAWRDIFSKPIAGGPTTRGFDSYFGTDVPNWPPYCFIENDRTIGIPSEFLPAVNFRDNLASLPGPALEAWKLEAILPTLGDRASAFIADAAKKPEPFLLYLPLTAPHTPLAVNAEWQGKSKLNTYADFVMETDATVGRVLDALQKSGVADHTLVIFTSDNGCAPYIGAADLEKMGHYPSGPLRGYKSDAWEGGHRVPFIVRWPGIVKPGTACGQIVLQADFLATIADILGAKLPDSAGEDSFSLLPLFRGEDKPVRDQCVNCSASGLPSVRSGAWKLILGPGSGGWGKGGDQSWPVQLYNLADDLGETRNLAAAQPERVEQMKVLLDKLITDGRSTPGTPQKNDVKVKRYPVKAAAPKKEASVPTHLSRAVRRSETTEKVKPL